MKDDANGEDALEQRWERIGLGVRCAYNPLRPEVLQHYLQAGRQLSRRQPGREAWIQKRMLDLLLSTAADPALPWHWRAVCLEQTAWPLARLASLPVASGARDAEALARQVQQAWECLGPPPRAVAGHGLDPGDER